MKKILGIIFIVMLIFFVTAGCGRRYINTLSPGDSGRVLGEFPGTPDNKGLVTINVVGKGLPPERAVNRAQAQLMAERAAVADGYRKAAEKIRGVYVKAYMRGGDGFVDYDRIQVETETWLRGMEVIEIVETENGIFEAHMRARVYVNPDHVLFFQSDS